jgi:hypothetical protein
MRTFLSLLSLVFALGVQGASFFVRPTQQGAANGSDWNNAWGLAGINWASVNAGDTVWLAGGTYTQAFTAGKSGTAGSRIYVKRATAGDSTATGAAGWSAGFDTQVIVTNEATSTSTFVGLKWDAGAGLGSYVTIDGRTTNGISLRVSDQTTPSDNWPASICCWFNTTVNSVVLTNIEFASVGGASGYPFVAASTGIYVNGSGTKSNVVVTHCKFRDMVQAIQIGTTANDWTIEHSEFANMYPTLPGGAALQHDNIVWAQGTTGFTFRYNRVHNWATEGLLLTGTGNGRWDIYGNLWYDSQSTGRIIETQANNGPAYFYQNTCVNVPGFGIRLFSGTSTIYVTNNIFFNCGVVDPTTKNYNLYSGTTSEPNGIGNAASGIFQNYGGKDYRIVSTTGAAYPRGSGVYLGSPYTTDYAGNLFANPPSIGAYEYGSGAEPEDPPVTPTTNRVTIRAGSVRAGRLSVK